MAYNVMNFPAVNLSGRLPAFKTILTASQPDILGVVEMQSQAGVNTLLDNVLNTYGKNYSSFSFINGPDSDGALFYDKDKFDTINQSIIPTSLRNVNIYNLRHKQTKVLFTVILVHLKASNTASDVVQRAAEVALIRNYTNALSDSTNFVIMGDFNIYNSNEQAYIDLLSDQNTNDGNSIDPIKDSLKTVVWNNSLNAKFHTQSPRIRSFDGGATGGMDDRFDMILNSSAASSIGGMQYILGSNKPYGNDGNHYNDSINHLPNIAVSPEVSNALHYAADHIPIISYFNFTSEILPVELYSFKGTNHNDYNLLSWQTFSEINTQYFTLERSRILVPAYWEAIAKMNAAGNSNSTLSYIYEDKNIESNLPYYYRLKVEDYDGSCYYSSIIEINPSHEFMETYYIFPNPVVNESTLNFNNYQNGEIDISIYDLQGNLTKNIYNGFSARGKYAYKIPALDLATGTYFIRIFINSSYKTLQFEKL